MAARYNCLSAYYRKQAQEQLLGASIKLQQHQARTPSKNLETTDTSEVDKAGRPIPSNHTTYLYYMTDTKNHVTWTLSYSSPDDQKLYFMEDFETFALTLCSPFVAMHELTDFKAMAEKQVRILNHDSKGTEGVKFYHKAELCALKINSGDRLICSRILLNTQNLPDQSSRLHHLYVPVRKFNHRDYSHFISNISAQEQLIRSSNQRLSLHTTTSAQPNLDQQHHTQAPRLI